MENCEWLNQLKIRGVYGKTGNGMNNAGYYTYYQTYSSGGDDYRLGTNYDKVQEVLQKKINWQIYIKRGKKAIN